MQMGKYHRIAGTAIALLTGFLLSVQPVSGMDIIKEGKAACVIVIPAKPLPAERFAADELRYHLIVLAIENVSNLRRPFCV